jgi:hypothetical protein
MDPESLQPMAQGVVPPPTSPPEAGAGMGEGEPTMDPTAGQYVGPEHMQKLDDLIQGINSKMSEYNSSRFVGENQLKSKKGESIRAVLEAMQSAGVDVSKPEEVSSFLESLRNFNPDLAEILEKFLGGLFGETPAELEGLVEPGMDQTMGQPAGQPMGQTNVNGPMNQYENLPQELRRPV